MKKCDSPVGSDKAGCDRNMYCKSVVPDLGAPTMNTGPLVNEGFMLYTPTDDRYDVAGYGEIRHDVRAITVNGTDALRPGEVCRTRFGQPNPVAALAPEGYGGHSQRKSRNFGSRTPPLPESNPR